MRRSNLAYIVWGLLVLGGIYGGSELAFNLQAQFKTDFTGGWQVLTGTLLIYFVLGLLLGVDHILREAERSGNWSVRKGKLFGLGLPCLLLLLVILLPFFGVKMPAFLKFLGIINYPFILYLLSLLLGNIISTSICRQELRIWGRAARRY